MEDTSDFEKLMREEGPRIYSLAVRLEGNQADGQDLAQETFIQAYKNLAKFRGDAQVQTWLYRICVNLWKNRVKYRKRRFFWKHFSLSGSQTNGETPRFELEGRTPPLGMKLENQERYLRIQQALGKLEPEDRAIVVLRDIEDQSYEEISKSLDVPMGTVKSRLARSRARLRMILEKVWE